MGVTDYSAGTAGRGYRSDPDAHPWTPDDPDWGRRPCCLVCGGEKTDHQSRPIIPTPRNPT